MRAQVFTGILNALNCKQQLRLITGLGKSDVARWIFKYDVSLKKKTIWNNSNIRNKNLTSQVFFLHEVLTPIFDFSVLQNCPRNKMQRSRSSDNGSSRGRRKKLWYQRRRRWWKNWVHKIALSQLSWCSCLLFSLILFAIIASFSLFERKKKVFPFITIYCGLTLCYRLWMELPIDSFKLENKWKIDRSSCLYLKKASIKFVL